MTVQDQGFFDLYQDIYAHSFGLRIPRGESLIQNYGHKYLDTNRRSLDLEQSFGLNFQHRNRSFSLQSTNYVNFGFLRPVSHTKDFFLYERFFKVNGWGLSLATEYSQFENNLTSEYQLIF